MSKKEKIFHLIDKKDYILYLYELIIRIEGQKDPMKSTLKELECFINKNKKEGIPDKDIKVSYREYERYSRMLEGSESYLFNLFGDHQASSMSYKKFRDIIKKKKDKNSLEFEIRDIDEEIDKSLKKLNKLRNWVNHVPESLLVADIKLIEEDNAMNRVIFNPIQVHRYLYCSLDYMKNLYDEAYHNYTLFNKVYKSLKLDYQELLGVPIFLDKSYTQEVVQVGNNNMRVAELSGKIQELDKE